MASLIRKCSALMLLALASAVAQNVPQPIPIPQMTPEELPARAPHVKYHDGELLIDADNSSLADVLTAVARETGAQIEEPPNAASERVAVRLSGTPRRVVAELLDGAKFGYVILSPVEDPAGIQRVIVTREAPVETRPGAAAQATSYRPGAMLQAEPGPTPEYRHAEGDADGGTAAAAPPVSPPQQPEAQSASSADPPTRPYFSGSDAQKSADPNQNPGPALVQQGKPGTEVLQELYRMRQTLQQQQNQKR